MTRLRKRICLTSWPRRSYGEAGNRCSQEQLAEAVGRNVRTIQNAETGKQRVQEAILKRIAEALGCQLGDIVISDAHVDQLECSPCIPGTPEYYLQALVGKWAGKSTVDAGKDQPGVKVSLDKFEWDVELTVAQLAISGTCNCRTLGYEHDRYLLAGSVNGRGFVMIDGVRAMADGADDVFRVLLQFHSDGKSRTMKGGYAMYWSEYKSMFAGFVELIRID